MAFARGHPGRMKNLAFYFGIACLFTHELDAVPNHEWRGLPLLRALPDEVGMWVFVAAHVPLFAILIALVASPNPRTRTLSRLAVSAFLLVHGLLHGLSMGQPSYEFSSALSNMLIFGGSVFGALHLILERRERTARPGRIGTAK